MPFRLTRQICDLMVPLRESGQLQSTMVFTMRALRNNHEILLNTMDVFIKEPLLDWQVSNRVIKINSRFTKITFVLIALPRCRVGVTLFWPSVTTG